MSRCGCRMCAEGEAFPGEQARLFAVQMIKVNIRCVRKNRRPRDPMRAWLTPLYQRAQS